MKKIKLPFSTYLYLFFATSILGWLWEVSIFLIKDHTFCNRGFLHGPWLPIYGCGSVFILFVLHHHRKNPFFVFFTSLAIGTVVELILGWVLDNFYHTRYWDYSNSFCNLNGYICLLSAFLFGLAGYFWVCVFAQKISDIWKKVPPAIRKWTLIILSILFVIDAAFSLFHPNKGDHVNFSASYKTENVLLLP